MINKTYCQIRFAIFGFDAIPNLLIKVYNILVSALTRLRQKSERCLNCTLSSIHHNNVDVNDNKHWKRLHIVNNVYYVFICVHVMHSVLYGQWPTLIRFIHPLAHPALLIDCFESYSIFCLSCALVTVTLVLFYAMTLKGFSFTHSRVRGYVDGATQDNAWKSLLQYEG